MPQTKDSEARIEVPGLDRTVVLVGLMGAGKTTLGRKLAARLQLPFADADEEIERAAGITVSRIFDTYGEPEFRSLERRVIQRLLLDPPMVLATGGGAFMDPATRTEIKARAISIWLRADLDLLERRVSRKKTRPLLNNGRPRETLAQLIEVRYPVYAEADITVDVSDQPQSATLNLLVEALVGHCGRAA